MRISVAVFCLICLQTLHAQNPRPANLKQAEWLVGSWQGTYKNAPFYEAWRKFNDSVLVNFEISIKDHDTLVKESGVMRILKDGSVINGSPTATWQLTQLTDQLIVLANDTLKFANRIYWMHSKEDHWLTEIHNPSGNVNYDMVRVPWLEAIVDRFISRSRK